ncbi:hypothetical protein ACU4GI_34390 [Cupriavidus basilensis]|uniref:hypothetical protein n=1 Tax=Cupriavidus sp. SK-3 TaxID=1470558 RepID=UPI001F33D3EC|nr:hypothetical protein [Cupriavidus sp. SK-3]
MEVSLTDEIVDLLGQRIDLSIRLGSATLLDEVVARQICTFRRRVVASPGYLRQRGIPAAPTTLTAAREDTPPATNDGSESVQPARELSHWQPRQPAPCQPAPVCCPCLRAATMAS